MAKNLTKAQQQKLELLKEEQKLNKSLLDDAEEFVNLGGKLTALQQENIKNLQIDKTLRTETVSLEKKLTKQSQSLNTKKSKQASLGKGILDSLKQSLKDDAIGIEQFKSQVSLVEEIASGRAKSEEIQRAINDLGEDATAEMKQYLNTQKKSAKSQELAKNAASAMDDVLGGMGTTIKNFLTNPLTIVAGLLTAFGAATDAIGKKFGAIGVTSFRKELGAARNEFVGMGLDGDEALSVISTLSNEFGIGFKQAIGMAGAVGDLAKSTGMSVDESAKLVGMLTATQGLTADGALNVSKSAVALAKANDVAPDQILKDIAGSSEAFAKFSDGSADGLTRAAVQARKLGTDLNTITGSMESSLDFQSSLTAEMEASAILGRRIDLSKARQLAYDGDATGFAVEIARLAGDETEFNNLKLHQRKSLAKALGMELPQLAKMVNKEKERLSLTQAISKIDMENIVPEESMSAVANTLAKIKQLAFDFVEQNGKPIENLFKFLAKNALGIMNGIMGMVTGLTEGLGITNMLAAAFGIMTTKMLAGLSIAIATSYFQSAGKLPGPLAMTALIAAPFVIGALVSKFASSAMSDGMIGPGGETIVSGPKGSIQLDKQDSMIVGTNLMGGGAGENQNSTANIEKENREMKQEIKNLRMDMKSYFGVGGNVPRQIIGGVGNAFANAKG